MQYEIYKQCDLTTTQLFIKIINISFSSPKTSSNFFLLSVRYFLVRIQTNMLTRVGSDEPKYVAHFV